MAGCRASLLLYLYLSSLDFHGNTSPGKHRSRVQDNGLRTVRAGSVNLCIGICRLAAFLGPLSEIYGRKIILQLTNLFYIVFNITCGILKSTGQMIAFRFLAGLGGSAPLAVCQDLFIIRG